MASLIAISKLTLQDVTQPQMKLKEQENTMLIPSVN